MKLVPNKTGGVSRRAYNKVYAKTASGKVASTVGKLKLRSDPIKPVKIAAEPAAVKAERKRIYSAPDTNISFGSTGYTEEDYS